MYVNNNICCDNNSNNRCLYIIIIWESQSCFCHPVDVCRQQESLSYYLKETEGKEATVSSDLGPEYFLRKFRILLPLIELVGGNFEF